MREMWVGSVVVALLACGDPESAPRDADGDAPDATPDAIPDGRPETGLWVGGSAIGVRGPIVIELTANDTRQLVPLTEDGDFQFAHPIPDGKISLSFVGFAPCEIQAPAETGGADVSSIAVICDGVAELLSLGLSVPIRMPKPFDPRVGGYTGDRWYFLDDSDQLQITPTAAYPTDSIQINTTAATSGQPTTVTFGSGWTIGLEHAAATSGLRSRNYAFTVGPRMFQEAYVKASAPSASAEFASVAVSGDVLAVGAPGHTGAAGVVYVFRRTGSAWSQESILTAANAGSGDRFGTAVAIDGTTIVVGAPLEDSSTAANPMDNGAAQSGAAYVFAFDGAAWLQQGYLKASNIGADDELGRAVAISGDTIAVGAEREDGSSTGINGADNNGAAEAGAAYVFTRTGGVWSQQAYVKPSNTGGNDRFGTSIALSADTLLVGARLEDGSAVVVNGTSNEGATDAGAAYVFVRAGTTWSQQAYVKASNTGANDFFGTSVSIDGDTLAVGATGEASGSSTNELDDSVANAGAVYIYRRVGTTWSKDAYLKAVNIGGDVFGTAIAIDRNHLVVGARLEGGSGVGPGATPNEGASSAGAVYAFRRDPTWSVSLYVKPSNTESLDNFGTFVALDGVTIAVGAPREDSSSPGINGNQANNGTLDSGAVYVLR